MALENIDSVSSAFVNRKVELYLSSDSDLDENLVRDAINGSGGKFVSMQKDSAINL